MNITVTDQPQCKKQLRIEIPGDAVRQETDKVATTLARQISVPGFRPGHVPKSVIKTRYRKELRDEVLSHLLPHTLTDAIKEKDLKVIGEPSIEDLKFKDDESIDVTFMVEVVPEFELSNYKQLPIRKKVYKIGDEDVEKTIKAMRERQAELVPVEDRGAREGDVVTVNITGRFEPAGEDPGAGEKQEAIAGNDEEAKKDGEVKDENLDIELGAEGVLKEFTESLAGAVAGESREFAVEYPADYKGEQYAGRRVNYSAEVTAVRTKEYPEVNDEFAQSAGEEFKTMDDLRSEMRKRLEEEGQRRSDTELKAGALEQLIDRNRFEVPEYVVERQIDTRLQTLFRQLGMQGVDPRQMNLDWERLREAQRERAEREVRSHFILDRIAESEKIEVSDEEIDKEIGQFAEGSGQDVAALRARLTKEGAVDSIKEQVRNRKALDFVIASAEIREEEVVGLDRQKAESGEGGQAEA
jgi:trigger factor